MDFYKNCFSPVTHGFPIIVWQAEGPQCPFGLVFAPVPQGGGAVIGLCHADVALGSALDSTGALWHPRPECSRGRKYADSSAGTRISPRKLCQWHCK